MTSCELCGKLATTKAKIEGVTLSVCSSCASLGTELKPPTPLVLRTPSRGQQFSADESVLVLDYGLRLRAARQRMKLTEKDAAQKLGIKENTLLHFEAGKLQPDDVTTKKLERFYSISLRESV